MLKKVIALIIQLVIMFNCFNCDAQNYTYTQYTTDDGLPTNYVYGAIEDERGFIWVYTENGISKFDGYTFQNYTTADGLPSNDIYDMLKDSSGTIWLGNTAGKVAYLEQDSIEIIETKKPYKMFGLYEGNVRYGLNVIKSFNGKNKMFAFNNRKLIDSVSNSTRILNYLNYSNDLNRVARLIPITNSSSAGFLDGKQVFLFHDNDSISMYQFAKIQDLKSQIVIGTFKWDKPFIVTSFNNAISFLNLDYSKSINYDWLNILPKYPIYTDLYEEKNGTLYVITDFCYIKFNKNFEVDYILDLSNITENQQLLNFFIDKKGNYWIGSKRGGLFLIEKCKQKTEVIENSYNQKFSKLVKKENDILAFSESLRSYKIIDKDLKFIFEITDGRKIYSASNWKDNSMLLATAGELICVNKNNEWQYVNDINDFQIDKEQLKALNFESERRQTIFNKIKCLTTSADFDKIFFSRSAATFMFDKSEDKMYQLDPLRCNAIAINNVTNEYFFAENKNLNKMKDSEHIVHNKALEKLTTFPDIISTIFVSDSNNLIIGTENAGMYDYNLSANSFSQISKRNYTRKIIKQDNYFFAATNNGVIKFDSKENNYREIYCYDKLDGLPSTEIHDILIDSIYLYAATNNGIAKIDLTFPIEKNEIDSSNLKINEFFVNDKNIFLEDIPEFDHKENNVKFNFHLMNFASAGKVKYYYKLDPIDDNWKETSDRTVSYSKLNYGDYVFNLTAKDVYANDYINKKPLKFIINKAIWETNWFYGGNAALFLLFLILVIRKREKTQRRKLVNEKKLNNQISELQMQSLRSQMNPHFIFNALGSIQYYIQKHKTDEADNYLTKFANLMRQYLDFATENEIVLEKEISMLKNYTNLEMMRFSSKFETEINIAPNINITRDKIPSMLVQPFVENSINHGLQTKVGDNGLLRINFYKENKTLVCEVIDNGIGIANAKKQQQIKLHKSKGMKNVKDRIDVLNKMGLVNVNIKIEELNMENEDPGTKIILKFYQN